MCQRISLFGCGCLRIDADDRLGVALAQVYPSVGKIDFDAVFVVEAFVAEDLFRMCEYLIYIDLRCEFDTVLGDIVVGESLSQFAYFAAFVG